jgi:hypothetical protein
MTSSTTMLQRRASLAGILALGVALSAGNCYANFVGLGQAGNYALFDVQNTQFQFNNSSVNGSVALGPGTTFNIAGGGGESITGAVYYQTGLPVPTGFSPGVPTGGTIATNLLGAVADAEAAAVSAASLTANLILPGNKITGPGSITGAGAGHENVIDLTQVNMTSGNFTIDGTADETFIFRVAGDFKMTNDQMLLSGGVTPEHVLWFFPNSTSTIHTSNSTWNGTILALGDGVTFDNSKPTAFNGAIIAADDKNANQPYVFSYVSGAQIDFHPFTEPDPPGTPDTVPAPAAVWAGLCALGVFGAGRLLRRRRAVAMGL